MNDKERILINIISKLQSAMVLKCKTHLIDFEDHVHFANNYGFLGTKKLKPGMLVLCNSNARHDWGVSFLVEPINDGWVLREIGSDRLCNMTNESFTPIVGMNKIDLLEGKNREFYIKVIKAFSRGGEYSYRFGGIDINKNKAVITIREVFGGSLRDVKSIPFSFEMKWNKKTSIKNILNKMIEAGYGIRKFETEIKE